MMDGKLSARINKTLYPTCYKVKHLPFKQNMQGSIPWWGTFSKGFSMVVAIFRKPGAFLPGWEFAVKLYFQDQIDNWLQMMQKEFPETEFSLHKLDGFGNEWVQCDKILKELNAGGVPS